MPQTIYLYKIYARALGAGGTAPASKAPKMPIQGQLGAVRPSKTPVQGQLEAIGPSKTSIQSQLGAIRPSKTPIRSQHIVRFSLNSPKLLHMQPNCSANKMPLSMDIRHFVFQNQKNCFRRNVWIKFCICHLFGMDFEEPRPLGRQNQLPHQILLYRDLSRCLHVQKTSDSKFFGLNTSFFHRMPARIPNTS